MNEHFESRFWDGITPDQAAAQNYLIYELLPGMLEKEEETILVENDCIQVPQYQLTIRPEVAQIKEQSAMLYLNLHSPKWGQGIFECAVGMGESARQAMGMASGSFLFAMLDGVFAMERGYEALSFETEFAQMPHSWQVYKSNLVGMGKTPDPEDCTDYWEALKEDIALRVGNQSMCYVKVYGAKNGDDITGECRVNDVKSEELSQKVAELVSQWDIDGFGSHKQFFFLRQEDSTKLPNAFSEEQIGQYTRLAVNLFHQCSADEEYETFFQRLAGQVGDLSLAQELYSFLPEICAENAFDQIEYPDHFSIAMDGRPVTTVYKTQLASYYAIHRALFTAFENGEFSHWANQVYQDYISVSSIYSVICKAKEDGVDLSAAGGKVSLNYAVREGYQLR